MLGCLMREGDNRYVIALTTVLSHVSVLPALRCIFRRGWYLEAYQGAFALLVSFMYHWCETFRSRVFLSELQWHRLDNIGGITAFALLFVHLCCIRNAHVDQGLRYFALFFAIVIQEKDPWNPFYTMLPFGMFLVLPFIFVGCGFLRQRRPPFHYDSLAKGLGALAVAIPFFVLGLDDENDPYRMFHGLWHLIAGVAFYHLWNVVRIYPAIHPNQGVKEHDVAGVAGTLPR